MDFEYTVLENGFDFILLSLNDLKIIYDDSPNDDARKRLLKYSLLNASSGVELVLKYYLLQNHWTYIFADMNLAKVDAFQKGEFTSADLRNILGRLENLCSVTISEDQKSSFTRLKERRNKAEHFILRESFEAIQASIHRSLSSLTQLIVQFYDLDKFSENEKSLFSEIKDMMRNLQQHYEDAKAIAQTQLEHHPLGKHAITCPECSEDYLICDGGVHCLFCDYTDPGEGAARSYIENVMNISAYSTTKHGGDFPQYVCPECGYEAFVVDDDNNKAFCFTCGCSISTEKLVFCEECGQPFEGDEDSGCLCTDCLKYKIEKG
jgi:hypothetical protein